MCRWEITDLRDSSLKEGTAKSFVMMWFRKSFQRRDASPSKPAIMKWFQRAAAEEAEGSSPLKSEIDVVPRTEFTASRQALNNINTALSKVGESSGVSDNETLKSQKGCNNKYCCSIYTEAQKVEPADNGDDASIDYYKNSKSSLIDNLRAADNTHALVGSINNETECRRPIRVPGDVKNRDYIILFDPYVDYGRLECPDSAYPSVIDYPTIRYGKYVQLKNKKLREVSHNFDLFTTIDKLESAADDKSTLNYKLLSNIEKKLDDSKYNLLNCKAYNDELKEASKMFALGAINDWKLEDFNDDQRSTRMSDDTRAIREFYKLSMENHVHIHYQNIVVANGHTIESCPNGFLNFFTWISLKGKEITEQHKAERTSWIKTILNFFKKSE